MDKVYQPIVIEMCDEIINELIDSKFFEEYGITDYTYAKTHICDELTKKYINNGLDLETGIFTEDEFDLLLKTIIASNTLNKLKRLGYVNSYEDDETEEIFFINDKGREYLEKLKSSK